jgi:hypothetical protein
VIPLIAGLTLFEGNAHIPFRRASGGFNTTVCLDKVFATTADGLCGSGVSITTESSGSVACLESVVNNGTDLSGWTGFSYSSGWTRITGSTIQGAGWRLQIFDVPAGQVNLLPSIFTMSDEAVFLQLPGSAVQPFAAGGFPISVRCDRAQWIEKTCGNPSSSSQVERGADGLFSVNPCVDTDLLIAALCNDSEPAFCQFTVELNELTLLEYGSTAGVCEVGENASTPGALLPGISRQVVGPRGPVQAYKSWHGSIDRAGVLKNPAKLTVNAKVSRGKVVLSLMFGDLSVPFSAEKYYADPEGFFRALGIAKPADGYSPEIANFMDNADVEAATSAIDLGVLKGGVNIELTTDLPKELITGQEFVLDEQTAEPTVEPTAEPAGLSGGAIAGIVIGGIAVVVGIIILICCIVRAKSQGGYDSVN